MTAARPAPPIRTAGRDVAPPELGPFALGEVAVYSACSPAREPPNQDAALVVSLSPERGVLAVADGLGGQPAGERASALALEELAGRLAAVGADGPLREAVLDGFEAANRAVLELGVGAGTTLVVVEVDARSDGDGVAGEARGAPGPTVRTYHVGDSEALVVGQRGRVKLQTISHSPVAYAVEAGFLDEGEALVHEDRHLVSNVLGSPDMRVEVGSGLTLSARDTLLVASDGLFDNLSRDEVVEAIRKGPLVEAVARLAESCRARMLAPGRGRGEPAAPSKPDDLTIVAFRPTAPRDAAAER